MSLVDRGMMPPIDKQIEAMNEVMKDVPITPGYDVGMTVGNVSYRWSSPEGRLKIERVAPWDWIVWTPTGKMAGAAAEVKARLHINPEVTDGGSVHEKQMTKYLEERKVHIEGDVDHYQALQDEIAPYRAKLDSAAQDAVPPAVDTASFKRKLDTKQDYQPQHPLRFRPLNRWICFSASSTPVGNLGQGNYVACNCNIDAIAWQGNHQYKAIYLSSLQWGAVGNVGMRMKAFGSQDFLNMDGGVNLFSISDAQTLIRCHVLEQANTFHDWTMTMAIGQGYAGPQPPMKYSVSGSKKVGGGGRGGGGGGDDGGDFGGGDGRTYGRRSTPDDVGTKGRRRKRSRQRRDRRSKRGDGDDGGAGGESPEVAMEVPQGENEIPVRAANGPKRVYADEMDAESRRGPPGEYCIAGSWDDYWLHDMDWDFDSQCYKFVMRVYANGSESFQLCRGRAKPAKLRCRNGKQRTIANTSKEGAAFQIRVYLKDCGSFKHIEWVKLPGDGSKEQPAREAPVAPPTPATAAAPRKEPASAEAPAAAEKAAQRGRAEVGASTRSSSTRNSSECGSARSRSSSSTRSTASNEFDPQAVRDKAIKMMLTAASPVYDWNSPEVAID